MNPGSDMEPNQQNSLPDPQSPAGKSRKKDNFARLGPPLFMYLALVTVFAVASVFVIRYVIHMSAQGK
jgi:hypothetical protein